MKDKKGKVCIIALCILAVFFMYLLINGNKIKTLHSFSKNYDTLQSISSFLAELEYSDIYIYRNDADLRVSFGSEHADTSLLDSEKWNSILNFMKNERYSVIIKDDGHIEFQRWATLDKGGGVVHCFEGRLPDSIFDLTELSLLSRTGWYYYESDYNRWREAAHNTV